MKGLFTLFFILFVLSQQQVSAQLLKKITGGNKSSDSSTASNPKKSIKDIISGAKAGGLTTDEIAAGLKEALSVGAEQSGKKLSALDGYFGNAAIKVLMPEEAKKVEQKLRSLGMGKQVDQAILSMNRAAEDAAKSAAPIFINAIKQMTIQDAMGILKGGDLAATNYLKNKTTVSLTESFRPVIEQSLKKVDATKYWNTVFTTYNQFSKEKVNTDLSAYVTEKALSGIFFQVGEEEKKIRKDP
ncbi:MAG: DUF4197 domain-containing protein, partial [Chitinophagaceae bacterium]